MHCFRRIAIVGLVWSSVALVPKHGIAQTPLAPLSPVGQTATPAFEGWYKNPDGTYSLSFGYFNRNFKEEPDIDVGANNRFSPGPEDRGQPTHFMTRRVFGAFAVVVPKEAAADKNFKLTWTITAHGQTIAIPGHLRPEWEIDALKESTSGNVPPILRFEPNGPTGLGPLGITASMKASVGQPA